MAVRKKDFVLFSNLAKGGVHGAANGDKETPSMKRIEAFSLAAVLCVGSLVGFAGARLDVGRKERVPTERRGVSRAAEGALSGPTRVAAGDAEAVFLKELSQDKLRSRRRVALDRFCDGLDAASAQRAVLSLSAGEDTDAWELRSQLVTRWAELDPAAAAEFAQKKMRDFLGAVLGVWAATDREAAKSFVAAVRDKDLLLEILPTFTRQLAESDLEEALSFANGLPADSFHNSIRLAFIGAGQKDPASAAARALTMPEGEIRGNAIEAAADVWLEGDPQAAMAWVLQHADVPTGRGGTLLQSAIQSWARNDPAAASGFLKNLPPGKQRDDGIKIVARNWAFKDRPGALQWVESLPDDKVKTEALGSVLSRWSYEDPAAAAAFLARQPASSKTSQTLASIGTSWARTDPSAAMAWAAMQQNEALEKTVAVEALGPLAADDPAAAIAGLASLRSAEARAGAIAAIASYWANRDADGAARWALELPAADAGSGALKEVIAVGTARDPVAMAGWLGTIKENPKRDVAVETFARSAQYYDPTAAARWANTLSDPGKRQPLVQEIVRNYANYDAPAARAWVQAQSFPPAERAALLGQIENAETRK